jgi:hypothetical protein
MSVNYKVLQERLFKRVHRTGEEIKNDFPNILRACIQYEAWKHFQNEDGKPFENLGEWLVYSFPNGVSMGGTTSAISYEDALQLCKDDRELHGLMVKHRPSGGVGGRPSKEQKPVNKLNGLPKRAMGTSRAYIEQRLQAEFPVIWKQYIRGEFRSARAAGIAAGFIKDTHDPVMRLKANWNKASRKQQNEFLRWLATEQDVAIQKTKKRARAK